MALWRIFGRRLFSKRRLTVGAIVASLPFIGYLMLLSPSRRLSNSFSANEHNSLSTASATKQIWNQTIMAEIPTTGSINLTTAPMTAAVTTDKVQVMNVVSRPPGRLEVHMWTEICGTTVEMLRNWPHFPYFPDARSYISDFHDVHARGSKNNGERVFGFIHPAVHGDYKFAISSDDTSELWLSQNEDPGSSEMIARVYSPRQSAWTEEGDYKKYPEQISKEFTLFAGKKYYVEALMKQGSGAAHLAVYWSYKNATFEIITSKYLSTYPYTHESMIPVHTGKRDNTSLQKKYSLYDFNRLPLLNRQEYVDLFPSCSYNPSFLVRKKLKRYEGVWNTRRSNVFPQDSTDMSNRGPKHQWSFPNLLIDGNVVQFVVDRFVNTLKFERDYYLKKIHKVIHKPDPTKGDRFLLNLELGSTHNNQSYRLSEHVYRTQESEKLCLPEGMKWNNSAMVYFILPVKDQGKWVHHFINELTAASLLTGDTNFHVIIIDFESKDIDMVKAFNTPLLHSRHTIISLTGKFYKTLALNKAVAQVPNANDIIFLYDLHIDVPPDIMDSVRMNTIAGKLAYFPIVGRLDCQSSSVDHKGFWQLDGYGLLAIYKSDWEKFGGMNAEEYKFKWGGEDWDLLDRVLMLPIEVERLRHPGLYHHYHTKTKMWS